MNPTTDLEPIGDPPEKFLADSLNILRNIRAVFETKKHTNQSLLRFTCMLPPIRLLPVHTLPRTNGDLAVWLEILAIENSAI